MENLYFIAIIPPVAIRDKITQLKRQVADRFDSSHALKSPPHITLHMPFKWKDSKIEKLKCVMNELNEGLVAFNVELKNFDFFEPRVVFVNVVANQSLNELQELVVRKCRMDLNLDNGNYKKMPFHPHVTIGFRDLKKRMFYQAKDFFETQSIHFEFQANRVELLKHNGAQWEISPT